MPELTYFICYSRRDGEDIALTLADQLAAGPPSIPIWIDRRNLQPGIDWDEQIVEALRSGAGVLYVMTTDSVSPNSECKKEWTRALRYNKPIIPLLFHKKAEMPFRLEPRLSRIPLGRSNPSAPRLPTNKVIGIASDLGRLNIPPRPSQIASAAGLCASVNV